MKSEQYYRIGLRLFAAMAIVVAGVFAYARMLDDGLSTGVALGLALAGCLLLAGVYFILQGPIYDFTTWLMRRCGKVAPTLPPVESAKPIVPDVIPIKDSPETEHDRLVLENTIHTVCRYTDLVFGDAINDEDKELLHRYLADLANMRSLPVNVRQIRVDREKINYVDLCHYGWNIWYALKCARNRFYDQKELVVWLKACFESLNRYDERTLRAKLRATDGVSYTLCNEENLKEYLERNDKKR